MSEMREPKSRNDYTVGWICPLHEERTAAVKMLDKRYERLPTEQWDNNSYAYGSIGEHNVVIASAASGAGKAEAALVADQMRHSFSSLRIILLVGIGGGVPLFNKELRLGDVVVSKPEASHGGVVQYDHGKIRPGHFERKGYMNSPPTVLTRAITTLQSDIELEENKFLEYLSENDLKKYQLPEDAEDELYQSQYLHVDPNSSDCSGCEKSYTVNRGTRDREPAIYFGTIASADLVMKDAEQRDRISKELGGIQCFEMEAAGLMNNFPCLTIRGISDYSDSHKNDAWHRFAAATAAACAKDLLRIIPPQEVNKAQVVSDVISSQPNQSERLRVRKSKKMLSA